MMGFYGGWGSIAMIAFWGLVILGIVVLVRWSGERHTVLGRRDDPLDILKRRYASGELTKERYEEMKRDLT